MTPIQGVGGINSLVQPVSSPLPAVAGNTANAGTAGSAVAGTAGLVPPGATTTGLPGVTPAAGAAAAPTALSAGSASQMLSMMCSLLQLCLQLCGVGGGKASAGSSTPAAAAKPATGAAGTAGNAQTANAPARAAGKPRIAVIDDFTSNQNGFQHGTEVSNAASQAAGGADIERLNGQGPAAIANSLTQLRDRAKAGDKVDVVNISQFVQGSNPQIQGLISELKSLGVPVVVAAGNNGPNQANGIGGGAAVTAANGTNQSGPGNVTGNGRTTSFAAADVSGRLAKLIASGTPMDQALAQVGARA